MEVSFSLDFNFAEQWQPVDRCVLGLVCCHTKPLCECIGGLGQASGNLDQLHWGKGIVVTPINRTCHC